VNQQVSSQITGGRLLAQIKNQLVSAAKPGSTAKQLDDLAEKLLTATGGQPSFKLVPGYNWSTCINVNQGIVHGIPKSTLKLIAGDLVTIDVGLFYQGYHTDTSTSFVVGQATKDQQHFLQVGRQTLKKAIAQAKAGRRIWDISHTIQTEIEQAGYSVVRNLTGHGVGRQLHEDPAIPCYTYQDRSLTPVIQKDQALAIEVMYCQGGWQTITDSDNWTIRTKDGSLSAVFEETIIVKKGSPIVTTSIS